MDFNTIRVLSLDGGGMRGYVSANFLKSFVDLWGVNPNELWKYFDVISGSSIGGIMALALSFGKSPEELLTFFTEDGPWIFTTSSSTPSVMPSTLSKVNTIVGGPLSNPTFYPSTTDGIGTKRLKSKLDSVFGSSTMAELNTTTVITSFEKNNVDPDYGQDTNTPIYFSNSRVVPSLIGQDFNIVDVAMATSAAPLYFPSWAIGEDLYIDGGVVQNNPAGLALSIAKAKKPTAKRYCVLSIGTGLGDVGFPPESSVKLRVKQEIHELRKDRKAFADKWQLSSKQLKEIEDLSNNLKALEGAYLIMYLLGVTTTGPQEVEAKELFIESNYTLEQMYYYRMQYYFEPSKNTEFDNSTPDILQYYKDATANYFSNDIDNITTFLGHLTA
jgi:predicted patatin/cPLA2 family phospholipase